MALACRDGSPSFMNYTQLPTAEFHWAYSSKDMS